jgi:hypothetical protein
VEDKRFAPFCCNGLLVKLDFFLGEFKYWWMTGRGSREEDENWVQRWSIVV